MSVWIWIQAYKLVLSVRGGKRERKRKEREGQGEKQNARIRGIGHQGEGKTRRKSRNARNEDTLCPDDYILQVSRLFLYFTYFTISFFNALSSRSVPLCPHHDKVKHAVKVRRKGNGKD